MAFTHTIARTYNDGISNIGGLEQITSDATINFDGSLAINGTRQVDLAFTQANLKSLMLYCDRAVTVKTNDSGTPQDTIALLAGQALVWSLAHDAIGNCPFSDDVTALYVVVPSGGSAAAFKLRALVDQTP
jgi:hypothetical protein